MSSNNSSGKDLNLQNKSNDLINYINRLKHSCTLKSVAENIAARELTQLVGFNSHHDPQKDWDCFKSVSYITEHFSKDQKILDVGASTKSVPLKWLYHLGYTQLYACDIRYSDYSETPINFSVQDLTNTDYEDNTYAA